MVDGSVAFKVVKLSQILWFAPATLVTWLLVIVISAVLAGQPAFNTDHLKIFPSGLKPVTFRVLLVDGSTKVPVPTVWVHEPVPIAAGVAVRVTLPSHTVVTTGPVMAAVDGELLVITTSAV